MEATIFCPKCGKQASGDRFCRSCGTHLVPVSEALSETERASVSSLGRKGGTTTAVFNSITISNENKHLNEHSATAVFGHMIVDLTKAPLPPGETHIQVKAIFGQGDILVPDDVAIRITGVSLFAEVKVRGKGIHDGFSFDEYISPDYEEAPRRLHINVGAIFAEVNIKE